jgi:formiminotetrahydrofolate cyclodeaminase
MRGGCAGTALAPFPPAAPWTAVDNRFATYNPVMPDRAAASFQDLTLSDFVNQLASSAPVPGGGSACAVAASLGAALVAMVGSLSEGRPKYADHADLHATSIETGRRLVARFLQLADEDASAYDAFTRAMKLPKDTEGEQATRRAALSEAARGASEVPFATVEACLELVSAAESLVGRSNVNAASDLDVAALLAEAAARGAAANVLINLPAVTDQSYVGETTARVMALLASVEEQASAAHSAVLGGESREPLPA